MAIIPISSSNYKPQAVFSAYGDASDDQLIALLQAGDDRAFEVLMARHRGIVWRVARQYLGTLQDAEDVFQDVSLSFFQNRNAYQPGTAKFSSWLYRVAVNRCLDIVRSQKSRGDSKGLDETIIADSPTGEDILSKNEISSQLAALLNLLPFQQKTALSLYYFDELDIGAISEKLSVSEGAARSLIKRGKEKIRNAGEGLFL